MSVKKEANGRRSVQVEVEVPGTPEQVWEAIATGPGVGAWFVPTDVDGRVGGFAPARCGSDIRDRVGARTPAFEMPARLLPFVEEAAHVAHERRHVYQAREVRQHPAFPR